MPFTNSRTNAKAAELRAYDSEDEASAKRRLEAAGWKFDVAFTFDDAKKIFTTDAIDTKKERVKAFPSESEKNGNGE
jgi:hypothetical protein